MNYEKVKKLKSADFKRYCGVHRSTFNDTPQQEKTPK